MPNDPKDVKDIRGKLGEFVNTTPLVAPAIKMGQIGDQIMQSPLYAALQHYINRLSTLRQQYFPVAPVKK